MEEQDYFDAQQGDGAQGWDAGQAGDEGEEWQSFPAGEEEGEGEEVGGGAGEEGADDEGVESGEEEDAWQEGENGLVDNDGTGGTGRKRKLVKKEKSAQDLEAERQRQEDILMGKGNVTIGESADKKKKRKVDKAKSSLGKDILKELKKAEVEKVHEFQEIPDITSLEREQGILLNPDGSTRLDPLFSRVLKPHQAVGVRFLWKHVGIDGQGCVLADYMGLGKTLQNISLMHTFLTQFQHDDSARKPTILVIAPTSVILNWRREMHKWMLGKTTTSGADYLDLFKISILDSKSASSYSDRRRVLEEWQHNGGCLITGYELFRMVVQVSETSCADHIRAGEILTTTPGPSLLIVDEGHRLREAKSQIVKAINKVDTRRRVVLTGYPLQNHLEEYWCMVDFARPGFIGTKEQFKHRFVIPIENGQASDSTEEDAHIARKRTAVLNELLRPIILRRDSEHLARELPPKYEWVLRCRLTSVQSQLYRAFVREKVRNAEDSNSSTNGGIIAAYHHSLSIVNHPALLQAKLKSLSQKSQTKNLHMQSTVGTPSQNFDAAEMIQFKIPKAQKQLGIMAKQGFVARNRLHPEKKQNVIYIEHVVPDGFCAYKLLRLDEVIRVEGTFLNGNLNTFLTVLEQEQRHPTKEEITLTVYRHHPTSFVYSQLYFAEEGCPPPPDEVPLPPYQEPNGADGSSSSDDGVEFVETVAQDTVSHTLNWAEPIMKDYPNTPPVLSQSGKMLVLFAILRHCRESGEKVIVFSQSVKTLNVIQKIIDMHNRAVDAEFNNNNDDESTDDIEAVDKAGSDKVPYLTGVRCGYLRLDGSTPQGERTGLVDTFNKADIAKYCIFLASTRAAGEGLNLQSASRVVMFDACWNPCLDHEAMCRAYRFGQTRSVHVYRLVAAGTMERTIFDQQTKKEGLTSRVVDARATKRTVTAQDLRSFFNLKLFNQLQKESVSPLVLMDEESDVKDKTSGGDANSVLSQEEIQQQKALKKDRVLRAVLREEGQLITKFRLEDLLMNQDDSERASKEDIAAALKEYKEQRALEEQYIAKGYDPSSAASIAASGVLAKYDANAVHNEKLERQRAVDKASRDAILKKVLSNPGVRLVQKKVFEDVKILLLRRRMPNSVAILNILNQYNAKVYLEAFAGIEYVISTWNQTQLESWKARQQSTLDDISTSKGIEPTPLQFKFRTVEWVLNCIKAGLLVEGGEPPKATIVEPTIIADGPPVSSSSSSHAPVDVVCLE
uniref:Helicase ATP-binding domain-containing protein n=1 Tax=Mucochytrium quahogii TaxID=96639 RepID=A0A7S2RAY1_9STRA|mmetsp:Transcript_12275/g.26294  ORF Transcript_12275/g.26294 Transcript_12275/m.26294 type:complete len:1237 (+) Transcript_12275:496-4206(+)